MCSQQFCSHVLQPYAQREDLCLRGTVLWKAAIIIPPFLPQDLRAWFTAWLAAATVQMAVREGMKQSSLQGVDNRTKSDTPSWGCSLPVPGQELRRSDGYNQGLPQSRPLGKRTVMGSCKSVQLRHRVAAEQHGDSLPCDLQCPDHTTRHPHQHQHREAPGAA